MPESGCAYFVAEIGTSAPVLLTAANIGLRPEQAGKLDMLCGRSCANSIVDLLDKKWYM